MGGANWSQMNNGLTDRYISALAIDPHTPATLYAGTSSSGVFMSVNGGETWSAINSGLTETNMSALAIDPQTPSTLYAGTTGGAVFKGQRLNSLFLPMIVR